MYVETEIQGEGFCISKVSWASLHYLYQKSVLLDYGPHYESSYAFVHPVDRTTQDTFISAFSPIFFVLSFSCTVILQAFLFVSPVNSYREHYWLATKLVERRRKIHVGWTRIVAGQKSDKRKTSTRKTRWYGTLAPHSA